MTNASNRVQSLSNDRLLRRVQRLAAGERSVTGQLIAALAELDVRQLYLAAGCSSLFTYCTHVLRLSEHAAYGRIEAARAARRYPIVLDLLSTGEITLTTVTLLAAHLTPDNHRHLLDAARLKSRRDVERLVVTLQPRPTAPTIIRRLPASSASAPPPASALPPSQDGSDSSQPGAGVNATPVLEPQAVLGSQVVLEPQALLEPQTINDAAGPAVESPRSARPTIAPLTPQRYRIQLTISAATHDKLRRAQDLMRHTVPTGDPAVILDRALTLLVHELERRKIAAAAKPRALRVVPVSPTRYVPASIRRAVWARDDGRCAFVGTHGRCTERGFLEFHHVKAYAEGGEASLANLQLRCRAHNQYEADQLYGARTNSVRTESRSP